ncbi:MAG: hypothetical protein KBD64_03165 [Gammaproteobacteria bacterium]|nr:hypothetical protein [Gammaproteobacteria bacterium]
MSISTEDISKLIETLTPVFGAADAAARVRRIAVSDAEKAEVREYLVSIGVEVEQIQEELDRRKDKLGRIQKIIDRCPELKTDHELLKLLLNAPLVRIVSVLAALAFCTALAGASRGGINPKLQAVVRRMLKAKSWQDAHEMEKAIGFLRMNHSVTEDTLTEGTLDGLISRDFSEAADYARTVNELSNALIALEEDGDDRAAVVAKVARSLEVSKEEQAERLAFLRSCGCELESLPEMRAGKSSIIRGVLRLYPQLGGDKSLFETFLGVKYQNMFFFREVLIRLSETGLIQDGQDGNIRAVVGLCYTQDWQKVEAFSDVISSLVFLSAPGPLSQETFDEIIRVVSKLTPEDLMKEFLHPVRAAVEGDLLNRLRGWPPCARLDSLSCSKLIRSYTSVSKAEREIISSQIGIHVQERKPIVSHTAPTRKLLVVMELTAQVHGLAEDYSLLKSLSRPGTLLKLVPVWKVLGGSGVELNKKNLEFVVKVAEKDLASINEWVTLLDVLKKSGQLSQETIDELALLEQAQFIHAWKSILVRKLGEGFRGAIDKCAEVSKKERREWKQYCANSGATYVSKFKLIYFVLLQNDWLQSDSNSLTLTLFLGLESCQLDACGNTLFLIRQEQYKHLATPENIQAVIKVYQRTKNWQEAKAVREKIAELLEAGTFNQEALNALKIPVFPRNWKPIIIGATVVGVSLLVVGGVAAVCFFAPGAFALVGIAGVASSFIAAMSAMGTFVAHVALPAVAQFLFALGAALLNLIGVSAVAHTTAAVATGVIAPVVTLGAVAAAGKLAYDCVTKPAKPRDGLGEAGESSPSLPDCFTEPPEPSVPGERDEPGEGGDSPSPWGDDWEEHGRRREGCWAAPAR